MKDVKVKRIKNKVVSMVLFFAIISLLAIVFFSGNMIVSRALFSDKAGLLTIYNQAYKKSSEKQYYDYKIVKTTKNNTITQYFECEYNAQKKENSDFFSAFITKTWTSEDSTKIVTEYQYERINNIGVLYNKTNKTYLSASIIGSLKPATGETTTSAIQLLGLHRLFFYTESVPDDVNTFFYKTYSCAKLKPTYIGAELLLGEKSFFSKVIIDSSHNVRQVNTHLILGDNEERTKTDYAVVINRKKENILPLPASEKLQYVHA